MVLASNDQNMYSALIGANPTFSVPLVKSMTDEQTSSLWTLDKADFTCKVQNPILSPWRPYEEETQSEKSHALKA